MATALKTVKKLEEKKGAPGRTPSRREEKEAGGGAAGVCVVKLLGLRGASQAIVGVEETPGVLRPLRAKVVGLVDNNDIGQSVAVMFENGDLHRPLVLSVIRPYPGQKDEEADAREVEIDGERLLLSSNHDIVLRCGKSSITLTRAGKVLIRGAYVSVQSSGAGRIKAASVQIN